MTGRDSPRCSLQPARSASFCCAQPRSVKPQITHSLSYETREEGEMMGGNDRKMRSSTHSGADKLSALCLSIASAAAHSFPSSLFSYRASVQGEDLHLFFISILKFRSSICQTFPPSLSFFSSSFFSFLFKKNFPGEVKWSGLLTQGDPD